MLGSNVIVALVSAIIGFLCFVYINHPHIVGILLGIVFIIGALVALFGGGRGGRRTL